MLSRYPIALGLMLLAAARVASAPVDFNREVRPILSDKCYHCHGPDESGRKAKLRFDTKEGALRVHNDTVVIVPGKSAESEIIFRVASTDAEEVMPPPEAKLGRLTAAEVATLKRWIDEGATFQSHWSFAPLAPVALPAAQPAL
ncbi:MAG: c-type cytochrome domain-containing protein, partial [Verrucomicrobiota bacterium]